MGCAQDLSKISKWGAAGGLATVGLVVESGPPLTQTSHVGSGGWYDVGDDLIETHSGRSSSGSGGGATCGEAGWGHGSGTEVGGGHGVGGTVDVKAVKSVVREFGAEGGGDRRDGRVSGPAHRLERLEARWRGIRTR